jgi:hypothetical protein
MDQKIQLLFVLEIFSAILQVSVLVIPVAVSAQVVPRVVIASVLPIIVAIVILTA